MGVIEYVLGAVLLLAAIFLVVVVMLQDKAKRGLSGAIAGGSNGSYLGKNGAEAKKKGKVLSTLTTVVAIVFVVIVVVTYLLA